MNFSGIILSDLIFFMSKEVQSPLVDVAMGYVNEVNSELDPQILQRIRTLFEGYIQLTVSFEDVSFELSQHLENISPLEKISDILKLAYLPAPPSPSQSISKQGDDYTTAESHHKRHHTRVYNNYGNWNLNSRDLAQSASVNNKNRKKTRSWTNEEDQRLLMGVHLYGLENWTLVAQFVGNGRTRSMCSQRWIRVLDPKISKNHWSEEEDQQLLQMIKLYGEKSWMKIATKLGNRSDVQCRYHYQQLQRDSKVSAQAQTAQTQSSPISKANSKKHATPETTQNSSTSVLPVFNIPSISAPSNPPQNVTFPVPTNFINHTSLFQPVPLPTPAVSSITPPIGLGSNPFRSGISTQVSDPFLNTRKSNKQTELAESADLTPLTEQDLQLRLDDPFGFEDSFDFLKADPMFNDSFWAY